MLPDVQTLVCGHLFRDCLETEIYSDKTPVKQNPNAHVAFVHLIPTSIQMLALVSKSWYAALNEHVDRQADDKVSAFLANSVLDGLELCHCNQYPDPWDMTLGNPEESQLLHSMQVGGELVASVLFVRKRNEEKRHVLAMQLGTKPKSPHPSDDPTAVMLSPPNIVQIPLECWVPDPFACKEIKLRCITWYEQQSDVLTQWLEAQRAALAQTLV